ncbi:MAG: hypothetical protein OHK0029_00850 [Armatimonadaceae bacterium]
MKPTAPETAPIIEVCDVSKQFFLQRARAGDLRERFTGLGKKREGQSTGEFWALKDINFTIAPGESVGIVGHNGSGKSTLLKLLTGILQPTLGQIRVRGRIGALIEVGAGFHPDLSGRENIYLNGSILGLSRKEIAARFDRIVSFAGLENFIDTPVKRYSSGMYMRLGFSVAAHTNPDILLIDEVMAVGDTQFQNRCIRFLKDYLKQGGTVVFVSHAMAQVAEICQKTIWLDYGQLRFVGPTDDAIEQYMAMVTHREEEDFKQRFPEEWAIREKERLLQEEEARRYKKENEGSAQSAEEQARFANEQRKQERLRRREDPNQSCLKAVRLLDSEKGVCSHFQAGQSMRVEIDYRFGNASRNPVIGLDFFRSDGMHMFTSSNFDHQVSLKHLPREGTLAIAVPTLTLNQGSYELRVNLFEDCELPEWNTKPVDSLDDPLSFSVEAGRFANGCVFMPVCWEPNGGSLDQRFRDRVIFQEGVTS